ncbi:MAG: transglycosylase domain-containing protein [Deltaproteobacteria bacterium]|nr:transglycosylase domain-containing protein [Deltaproteobacteria bacterium]
MRDDVPADFEKPVFIQEAETPRQRRRGWLAAFLAFLVAGTLLAVASGYLFYQYVAADLPKVEGIGDYRPNLVTHVYDRHGTQIGEFKFENQTRYLTPIDEIPRLMIDAFVAVEDEHFFEHGGLDYAGIARAFVANLKGGEIKQGASTITMQVCRGLLLSRERTYTRKLKEAILAQRLEDELTKDEILYIYLNDIYFGHGAYGVAAAAHNYFGKALDQLTLGEIALIVGLPQAPSKYNPYRNPKTAMDRRRHVLRRMEEVRKIDRATAEAAAAEPIDLIEIKDINKQIAPYFTEYVRQYAMKRYGADAVLKDGLQIYTTCDLPLQNAARNAVRDGLGELTKRQGYTGAERNVARAEWDKYLAVLTKQQKDIELVEGQRLKGLVTALDDSIATIDVGGRALRLGVPGIKWVTQVKRYKKPAISGPFTRVSQLLKTGDVVLVRVKDAGARSCYLDAKPQSQAALLSMKPDTREVLAVVGGYDFADSEFNRALQARRQPGSSFKPIVYSAALNAGMTPAMRIMDTALVFADGWRPRNYSGKFQGDMTLRQALTKSVNTVTVRVAQRIGTEYIERYAKRLGIESLRGHDLSMALGSYEVIPAELINAYAVFASGGIFAEPIFVSKIVDRDGKVLEENTLSPRVETLDAMTNVPRIGSNAVQLDLPEGDPEMLFPGAAPGQQEFMDDFKLAMRIAGIKNEKRAQAASLEEANIPEFRRDDEGHIVSTRVMSKESAFLITSMLNSVATSGTGARSNVLGKTLAGKTGTTNNNVDAWFIGFSPDLLAGVWVGNDAGAKSLGHGETGSAAALPIWIDYMKAALADAPNRPFPVPPGVETVMIDPATGLRAYEGQPDAVSEYFLAGTAPVQTAPSPDAPDPDAFEMMDF